MDGAAEDNRDYDRFVDSPFRVIVKWSHSGLWASLAWIAVWQPAWAPVVAASALGLYCVIGGDRDFDPWPRLLVVLSTLLFLGVHGGWMPAAGWFVVALFSAVIGWSVSNRPKSSVDPSLVFAIGTWGVVFVFAPRLIDAESGGWLAPAILLMAVHRMARRGVSERRTGGGPAPPTREVRGTLSLEGVVLAGIDGLPRTAPIDLELRPGQSVGVLCDDPDDTEALVAGITGRARPHAGVITIDGAPMAGGSGLVAVIAPGEPFVEGGLRKNLGALCPDEPDRSILAAVYESCSLAEVAERLGDRPMTAEGDPLPVLHRLLVLAARVIPSQYHVVVVVDPVPWVDSVRREIWRRAVVRASLGRTAIWITPDRELAYRATEVLEFRDGAFRSPSP